MKTLKAAFVIYIALIMSAANAMEGRVETRVQCQVGNLSVFNRPVHSIEKVEDGIKVSYINSAQDTNVTETILFTSCTIREITYR